MRPLRLCPAVGCLLGALSPGAPAAEPLHLHHYEVTLDPQLSRIQVRACFSGETPRRLVAGSLDAASALREAHWSGGRRPAEPNGPELRLGPAPGEPCFLYEVDVAAARRHHEKGGSDTRHYGQDLVTSLGVWFWRPEELGPEEDIEVHFTLPPGFGVSAPWPPLDHAAAGVRFRVGHSPADWPATVAFGHFQEQAVEVPGGVLRVSVLDGSPTLHALEMASWLQGAGTTASTVYGRLPQASVQVIVLPGPRSDDPVPSAYVLRGGAPAAHFLVNPRRPRQELLADWTPIHELSHLLLPQVRSEDAWASEGLASYYQHVLRARAGILSQAEAWGQLHRGFELGRHSLPGLTLAEATERMYSAGSFLRVYWEGAALWLLADYRLRTASDNQKSLDTALEALQGCCLSPSRGWSAADLFARLDELTDTVVFTSLYREHVNATPFPDLTPVYQGLGLVVDVGGGGLSLLESAPGLGLREAIMSVPARR